MSTSNPDWQTVDCLEHSVMGDADFVLSMMACEGVIHVSDVARLPEGDWVATIRIKR